MSLHKFAKTLCVLVPLGAGAACGGKDASAPFATPYAPGSAVVVGDVPGGTRYPEIGQCRVEVCSTVQPTCGDGSAADIVLDSSGKVVDVVCYGQDVSVDTVSIDQVGSATAKNNTVLVVDSKADGTDVTGDVTISGNNAIVYGGGPDVSVIGGTVSVEKNNAKIRGVRIQGDVTISKNDTKLLFCVIEGNLTITGNNTTVAECDVYGKVTVEGNNTVFVSDRFNGVGAIAGKNLTCSENVRFDDANGDLVVAAGELGGPVTCE